MGMDVAVIKFDMLPRPTEAVKDFILDLILRAPVDVEDGVERSEMEQAFRDYSSASVLTDKRLSEVRSFIDGLPWDEESVSLKIWT